MNEFMTPETLATFTGLVLAVSIIVQFTKSIIKKNFQDYAVRIYALVIALILVFVFIPISDGVEGIVINIINAILVTIASLGTYEVVADPRAKKEKFNIK